MTTFKELGLKKELLESLEKLEFSEATAIQEKAIPFILNSDKDLIALAQTGTGKTAAFSLPILHKIKQKHGELQAIILCPTRELCIQISRDIEKLSANSNIKTSAIYGGENIMGQIRELKNGVNIVVGTPGRVCDMIRRKVLKLETIKWLVLDEADEMLDMGFKEDLDAILSETPESRQTLLFSATISKSVQNIAKNYMNDTEEISIGAKNTGADNVSHEYYMTGARNRFEALKRILDSLPGVYGILFCRTRAETQDVAERLKRAGYDTESLHGDISQNLRTKIMDNFKKKKNGLLVATDVAARGIDVSNLSHVINYNLPDSNESYTHRSGRTGRATKKGISISIVSPGEKRRIRAIENIIGKEIVYKKIASAEEVLAKQVDKFVEQIEKLAQHEKKDNLALEEIEKKLNKINKEDLIKILIDLKFSDFINNFDDHDLNAPNNESDNHGYNHESRGNFTYRNENRNRYRARSRRNNNNNRDFTIIERGTGNFRKRKASQIENNQENNQENRNAKKSWTEKNFKKTDKRKFGKSRRKRY
jgi:ATP-dependent RNA helicase DeaD